MITKNQAELLKKKIQILIQVRIDDSWKGGGDPESIPEIEEELKIATKDLNTYIKSLTLKEQR